jgi:thiol-disulfide isomerase/thioredoxin
MRLSRAIVFMLAFDSAAAAERIVVPLQIEKDYRPPVSRARLRIVSRDGQVWEAQAPGGTAVRIEPKGEAGTFQVTVDADGDGLFVGEAPVVVTPESAARVVVTRRWPDGRSDQLPYDIVVWPRSVQDDRPEDVFRWLPAYRAHGQLKVAECQTELGLLDYDGNGVFDGRDTTATTLSLAREKNGRPRWLYREEIIEYCGQSLLLEGVEPDGSAATFVTTTLRVPNVGDMVPAFSLETTEGRVIDAATLRGRVSLLDFWASWCVPCIEKFSAVSHVRAAFPQLDVIAINVDEVDQLAAARDVVAQYGISRWTHVMSGKAEDDPLWKMLGGMDGNHFGIPQYVLVDVDGRIAYAGRGGEDLKDLRARIEEILPPTPPATDR